MHIDSNNLPSFFNYSKDKDLGYEFIMDFMIS